MFVSAFLRFFCQFIFSFILTWWCLLFPSCLYYFWILRLFLSFFRWFWNSVFFGICFFALFYVLLNCFVLFCTTLRYFSLFFALSRHFKLFHDISSSLTLFCTLWRSFSSFSILFKPFPLYSILFQPFHPFRPLPIPGRLNVSFHHISPRFVLFSNYLFHSDSIPIFLSYFAPFHFIWSHFVYIYCSMVLTHQIVFNIWCIRSGCSDNELHRWGFNQLELVTFVD